SPPDLGWRFAGAVADEGATVRVRGTLRIQSSADLPTVPVHARLARAFDAQGSPTPLMDAFATATRTPAGFPLERMTQGADPTLSDPELCKPVREDASTLRCDVDVRAKAAGLPAGGWAVKLLVPVDGPRAPPNEVVETSARQYVIEDGVPLSILPRGLAAPMRLATLLLVDQLGQTDRGEQAHEGACGWTNAIAWQAMAFVQPQASSSACTPRSVCPSWSTRRSVARRMGAARPRGRMESGTPSSMTYCRALVSTTSLGGARGPSTGTRSFTAQPPAGSPAAFARTSTSQRSVLASSRTGLQSSGSESVGSAPCVMRSSGKPAGVRVAVANASMRGVGLPCASKARASRAWTGTVGRSALDWMRSVPRTRTVAPSSATAPAKRHPRSGGECPVATASRSPAASVTGACAART